MSAEVGSVKPNPYLFDIENRRKRKPRLAHDLGAGAKCNKCGDKCPGFDLHFWRKICKNCRCGKDDHDVEDDDEDIGKVVIGKLFDRPARTKKEELEFSYGNNLELLNEETGKSEKLKFDWVPPNIGRNLAARYMALLPPEKRPVAGSEAAKERRRQLEQQLPLYDMDASQRCENLPAEELQSFQAYLERIKTQVAGQGIVQEIIGMTKKSIAHPLHSQPPTLNLPQDGLSRNSGSINSQTTPLTHRPFHDESSNTYAIPCPPINAEKSRDMQYRLPGIQADLKNADLKEFMGEMMGESGRSMANSKPYGVAPEVCQPLSGLGPDQSVEGAALGLSDLSMNRNWQNALSTGLGGGHLASEPQIQKGPHVFTSISSGKKFPPGPHTALPYQSGYVPSQHGQIPYLRNSASDKHGIVPNQEGYTPGKDVLLEQGSIPNKEGLLPDQESFPPGKQGQLPNQGFVPSKEGLLPYQEGFAPGKQGLLSNQDISALDKHGHPPNQESFAPGNQGLMASQEDFASGKQGLLPNIDGHLQNPPQYAASDQALTPGKDNVIHRYHVGVSKPTNNLAYQETGAIGSQRASGGHAGLNSGQEGGRGLLHQMPAGEGNVAIREAVQAPYGAHMETLTGGSVLLAPGSDVTVLFPDESQILGPQGKGGEVPSQKSKFLCQYCNLPMNVGDVAIFCERAGQDKCWHPACFSCYTCKELLADLIYFYKDGKVYCGRHFTDAVDMPRCKACDELIFGNSWTRADNFDWHLHHFCCNVCDTALAGQRYVPNDEGLPYCLPCYMAYMAKMCEACEEKISPEENRCGHRGYFYHANPQCFRCYSCRNSLLGQKFKMSKNWVFCSNECIQAAAEALASNPNPKEKIQ